MDLVIFQLGRCHSSTRMAHDETAILRQTSRRHLDNCCTVQIGNNALFTQIGVNICFHHNILRLFHNAVHIRGNDNNAGFVRYFRIIKGIGSLCNLIIDIFRCQCHSRWFCSCSCCHDSIYIRINLRNNNLSLLSCQSRRTRKLLCCLIRIQLINGKSE